MCVFALVWLSPLQELFKNKTNEWLNQGNSLLLDFCLMRYTRSSWKLCNRCWDVKQGHLSNMLRNTELATACLTPLSAWYWAFRGFWPCLDHVPGEGVCTSGRWTPQKVKFLFARETCLFLSFWTLLINVNSVVSFSCNIQVVLSFKLEICILINETPQSCDCLSCFSEFL